MNEELCKAALFKTGGDAIIIMSPSKAITSRNADLMLNPLQVDLAV